MFTALNLYAGRGGNRHKWKDVEVTAIESDSEIAACYRHYYPNDKVIVTDAHKFLIRNLNNYDFIWASPVCVSHTKLRLSHPNTLMYPDLSLYQEIIILKHFCKAKWVVENVDPYYEMLMRPKIKIDRHYFWSNFDISKFELSKPIRDVSRDTKEGLSEFKGINIDDYNIKNKRLLLRNAVHPKIGEHILKCAFISKQKTLLDG